MIFKVSDLRKTFLYFVQGPKFYGKGGTPATPTNTTSTVNQNSIPAELMPYALGNIQAAQKQLFTTDDTGNITGYQPFAPYSTDPSKYVAGFSPLQQQAQQGTAALQLPGQYAPATGFADAAGAGQLGTAGTAAQYGAQGSQMGQTAANVGAMGGLGYGAQSANLGMTAANQAAQGYNAGANFAQQATNPNDVAAYMSPYMQNVMNQQIGAANRQYDISGTQQQGAATQAGAFGGSREALMASENERNRNTAIGGIQATGYQNAFTNAQAQQQQAAQLGLQGMNAGNQTIQTGLQGIGQGITGVNTALQGYQQGVSGAQAGLAGVSGQQAGYNGANTAANTLGDLGGQQLASETGVLNAQNTIGQQQTAQQQQIINQDVLNYQNAQNQPLLAAGTMSDLIKGTPTPGLTTQTYTAQPSIGQQIGGALGSAGSLLAAANGGIIGYANGGSVGYAEGGVTSESAVESYLDGLTVSQLQQLLNQASSAENAQTIKQVIASKEGMATGGIVAFANGGQDWTSKLEDISQEMKANEYKSHGWSDEDIANYESSKRVPTDPNKQVAVREQSTLPKMPESEGEAYNRYKAIQDAANRVPESEVIHLPDQNVKSATSPRIPAPAEIEAGKGIAGYRAPASEYTGYNGPTRSIGGPAMEGELLLSDNVPAASKGIVEEKPIEGRKLYGDETADYKKAMEERAASKSAGESAPKNAGQILEEKLNAANGGIGEAAVEPTGSTIEPGKGLVVAKNVIASKLGAAGADSQSVMEMANQLANTPKEQWNNPELQSKIQQMFPAPDGFKPREWVGDVVEGLSEFVAGPKFTKPARPAEVPVAQQQAAPTGIAAAAPVSANTAAIPGSVTENIKNPIAAYQEEQANRQQIMQQEVAQKQAAAQGQPQPVQQVQQQAQPLVGEQATSPVLERTVVPTEEEALAQAKKSRADAGVNNNYLGEELRNLMAERANNSDEAKRQSYLRMAEFFAHWGATPGPSLVAGLKALQQTMPGYLEDKKDQAKLSKALNQSMFQLKQSEHLDAVGLHTEASKLRDDASKVGQEEKKLMYQAETAKAAAVELARNAKERQQISTTGSIVNSANALKATQNRAANVKKGMTDNQSILDISKDIARDTKTLNAMLPSKNNVVARAALVEKISLAEEEKNKIRKGQTTTSTAVPSKFERRLAAEGQQ